MRQYYLTQQAARDSPTQKWLPPKNDFDRSSDRAGSQPKEMSGEDAPSKGRSLNTKDCWRTE